MSDSGSLSDSSSGDKDFISKIPDDKLQANRNAGKSKRHTACELCRRRKLKCDGVKPTCGTCVRLKKTCQYTTVHKKSGPQRGYLKRLEDRLEQLEKLLARNISKDGQDNGLIPAEPGIAFSDATTHTRLRKSKKQSASSADKSYSAQTITAQIQKQPSLTSTEDELLNEFASPHSSKNPGNDEKSSWRHMSMPNTTAEMFGIDKPVMDYGTSMMSLNVEEPYPCEEIVSQLVNEYFSNKNACFQFLQQNRFQAMLNVGKIKPYLLYSVLLTGASYSENSMFHLQDQMYKRAIKYVFKAEHSQYGQELVNLQYVQALILLAIHENRIGSFGRAWLTVGKAIKASFQTNLHNMESQVNRDCLNLNGTTDNIHQHDIDERRRTIWTVYTLDMYCSIGSGWPTGIKLEDIKTKLPLDDGLFNASIPEPLVSIDKIIDSPEAYINGDKSLFALSVVSAYFMGEAFMLATKGQSSGEKSSTERWWKTQSLLSEQINSFINVLPRTNMINSEEVDDRVICLQLLFQMGILGISRSAVLKLRDQNDPDGTREFKIQCQKAASNMVHVLRACRNLYQAVASNPCVVFCLYTTARSFITMLEEERTFRDVEGGCFFEAVNGYGLLMQIRSQLDFIITVMKVLRPRMVMVECFYEKLQADIHRANLSTSSEQMNSYDEFVAKMQRKNEEMASDVDKLSLKKTSPISIEVETATINSCKLDYSSSGSIYNGSVKSTSITPDSQLETPPSLGASFTESPSSFTENLSIKGPTDISASIMTENMSKKRKILNTSAELSRHTNSTQVNRRPQFGNKDILFEVNSSSVKTRESGTTYNNNNNLSYPIIGNTSFSPIPTTISMAHGNQSPPSTLFYAASTTPPVGIDRGKSKSMIEIANTSDIMPHINTMAAYDEFNNESRRNSISIMPEFLSTKSNNISNNNNNNIGRDHSGGVETVNSPSITTAYAAATTDGGSIFGMSELLQWNSALSLDDIIQRIN